MNKAAATQLIDGMPDLMVVVTRNGTLLSFGGGRAVPQLIPKSDSIGRQIDAIWTTPVAAGIQQLVRKAIATRRAFDAELTDDGFTYQVRITPEGPDRALCMLRAGDRAPGSGESLSATGSHARPYADRRGFLKSFEEIVAVNVLTETPLALVTLSMDGVDDIARLDAKLAVRVVTAALLRLSHEMTLEHVPACVCTGQVTEDQLAFAIETNDRRTIEDFVAHLRGSLIAPLLMDQTTVTLQCFAGVAILGRDASSTKGLLDNARIAASEARRAGSCKVRFFSDTMKMMSLARIDIARELRDAIAANAIRARYIGRHDLASGRLVTVVAYARWPHALRGTIAAKEFVAVADATGAAVALSRAILAAMAHDVDGLKSHLASDVRISYGPLRQHLFHEEFLRDIKEFLALGRISAEQFEVRIAEATFVALPSLVCETLDSQGIQIVVDEVARGAGSLNITARAPLWGLQLDRAWVEQVRADAVARRICRAGIAMAAALDIAAIAAGIDNDMQRLALMELGCRFGSGDLYATIAPLEVGR